MIRYTMPKITPRVATVTGVVYVIAGAVHLGRAPRQRQAGVGALVVDARLGPAEHARDFGACANPRLLLRMLMLPVIS